MFVMEEGVFESYVGLVLKYFFWGVGVRLIFFFSSRRRHTRFDCDWSSDVCSSDLSRCLRAFNRLTLFSDSSASPGLRLPGLLHYREGFRPLTVAPNLRDRPSDACFRDRKSVV